MALIYWAYNSSARTFTLSNSAVSGTANGSFDSSTIFSYDNVPWASYASNVTTVSIANTIYPTSTAYWFRNFSNLTVINDIGNIDTSNATTMEGMFQNCSSLINIDVSEFDTSNVIYMNSMLSGCSSLVAVDVSGFNTSTVTSISDMFSGCSSIEELDLSNFDVSAVMSMNWTFTRCSKLRTIYANCDWNINSPNSNNLFYRCYLLVGGNGTTYNGSHVTGTYAHPDVAGNPGYFTSTIVTHTVSFNMQGHGTQVSSQTITDGQTATEPSPAPTESGYTFWGWYEDSACTTAFNFSTPITADKTLYAKWTAIPQYTVSFNLNGHGGAIPTQTVYSGQTATRPADPEAEGYIFQGWFDSALTTAFDFTSPIIQNTIIHAKWYMIPVLNWNGNRHNEGYTFKRVEWPNFQEHESYNYITKGSIEYSTEADLKTTGSFDFEGYDIPNVNDLIRVYYDFTDEQGLIAHEPLGTFFVNYAGLDYEDTIKGIKASGTLEGSSVLKVLQDKQVGMPYTVKKNANAVYVADDLIKAAGLQTNLEASGFVLSVDHTFDSGTTYLEMVNWLLTTAGYAEAYPDGNGTVQIVSMATIQSRTVKQTFKNNEQSIMYPEVEEANDWQETPNVVRLLYNTDDACIVAEATNVTGSRASLDARGNREKTYFEEVSDIGDGTKTNLLKQLAEDTLKEQSCDVEYVTLSHAFVPMQILDLIEIEYSNMKWSGLADNISIELEPSTKTQTKIKRTLYEDIVITSSATVYRS